MEWQVWFPSSVAAQTLPSPTPIPSESSYLGDSVGGATNNNGGCCWAVGGVRGDDISGVNNGVVGPGRDAGGGNSNSCEGGELHLDGC